VKGGNDNMKNQYYDVAVMDLHAPKLPETTTVDERLIWVLSRMYHSSKIRLEHFKHLAQYTSEFITKEVEKHPISGIVTKNKDMYAAIHVDFVSKVLGAVESFQGASATAYEYTSSRKPDLEKILSILINPKGRREAIKSFSKKKSLSRRILHRLSVFPKLNHFNKSISDRLEEILKEPFMKFESTIQFSQKFLDEYKVIRDVFSHNYRFVFHEEIYAEWESEFDELIIGVIQDSDNFAGSMAYVGAIQRISMGNLLRLLSDFEQWIYSNLITSIANKCKPTLPRYIPYLESVQRKEYISIRDSQKYDYTIPNLAVHVPIQVDSQAVLVIDFLQILREWGYPLWTHDKTGNKRKFPVKKLVKQLERQRATDRKKEIS